MCGGGGCNVPGGGGNDAGGGSAKSGGGMFKCGGKGTVIGTEMMLVTGAIGGWGWLEQKHTTDTQLTHQYTGDRASTHIKFRFITAQLQVYNYYFHWHCKQQRKRTGLVEVPLGLCNTMTSVVLMLLWQCSCHLGSSIGVGATSPLQFHGATMLGICSSLWCLWLM